MKLPPIILVGIDNPIGLTAIRELGGAGVPVHGIARSGAALGLRSRFLARGYVRPREEAALPALIEEIARASGAPFLMTVSMNDALALRAAADAGALPSVRPLIAPLETLNRVNDKSAVCTIAERLGIDVPRTWQPEADALETPVPALRYPLVLKWRDPEIVAATLARLSLPMIKSEIVDDGAGLGKALGRYRSLGRFPMVQAYAPGYGLGQMMLMKGGKALLSFQHRRLHEWPPEGGTSTLCESVALDSHGELFEKSRALLEAVGWEGPAMVEYRHDPATGRSVLMEINGRLWGSLPLASHAGARFALGTYQALGLGIDLPPAGYEAGRRCRYIIPETRRLARVAFGRAKIADKSLAFNPWAEIGAYLTGFFRPRTSYYVWSRRDPRPFLADMRQAAAKALGLGSR